MIIDRSIWQELAASVKAKQAILLRRIHMNSEIDFFASVLSPSGLPAVLIEADKKDLPRNMARSCKGFNLRLLPTQQEERKGIEKLLLDLTDIEYKEVFYVLADDLAEKMNNAKNRHFAVMAFFEVLSHWIGFFEKHGKKGLSDNEQNGLYGELWNIKNILFQTLGIEKTILAWVGPEGANQDFAIDNFLCEVKTSVIPPHEKFNVSNVLQLDVASAAFFTLVFIALEVRQSNINTLPQLVKEIRVIIQNNNPQSLDLFDGKLIDYGYHKMHDELYLNKGFTVMHHNIFHIRNKFPRLQIHELPLGVGDVRYSVAISACLEYSIDIDILKKALTEKE